MSAGVTGKNIFITRSPALINKALQTVHYLAVGAQGEVDVTISVTDSPLRCTSYRNNSSLCDYGLANASTAVIKIFVIQRNHAPVVQVHTTNFEGTVGQPLLLNCVSVCDPDLVTSPASDPTGDEGPAWSDAKAMSVLVQCELGRSMFPVRDGVSFSGLGEGQARGLGSGQVQMRGTRTAVNQALAHMRYLATCAMRDRDWDWAAGWALDKCRCEARGRP